MRLVLYVFTKILNNFVAFYIDLLVFNSYNWTVT